MRFLIVSHVVHKKSKDQFWAYGPYVKEMNLWFNYVDQVTVLAPLNLNVEPDPIDLPYIHPSLSISPVPEFDLLTWSSRIKTTLKIPGIFFKTLREMALADHIHLRCPGNMGLVGSIAQCFFPRKTKTAKYAGNWDPKSTQPFTYKLQRILLENELLSRNIQVLVYGNWKSKSKNIKSFFTATYSKSQAIPVLPRDFSSDSLIRLIFVGSLHRGKNPLLSVEAAHILQKSGIQVRLDMYGEGEERTLIQSYIDLHQLQDRVFLHGNVSSQILIEAYSKAHFLLFASESEGWPKAVAESMFWACLPITTAVSCVPDMLADGHRGVLVPSRAEEMAHVVKECLANPSHYQDMCLAARDWSRKFTLEKFEEEIKSLLTK